MNKQTFLTTVFGGEKIKTFSSRLRRIVVSFSLPKIGRENKKCFIFSHGREKNKVLLKMISKVL